MPTIENLTALEILDSRGRPTVGVRCTFKEGASAWASIPSGASTGKAEAVELRDGDPTRYGGLGCRHAVANVNGPILTALRGREFAHQRDLDSALLSLDGSDNKSRLGANAILAVSIAFARAYAVAEGIPLYRRFAHLLSSRDPVRDSDFVGSASRTVLPQAPVTVRSELENLLAFGRFHPVFSHENAGFSAQNQLIPKLSADPTNAPSELSSMRLPRLTVNLFSGGKHAGGQVPIQDMLVVPLSATTIDESLATTYAVYQAAAKLCAKKYNVRTLVADEGGLAPPFATCEAMLEDAVEAIRLAGFTPGRDVALAVDVASSHFYYDGRYHLDATPLTPRQMIDQLLRWLDNYPILSIEDGLSEDDWENWPILREAAAGRALILGDDFLCTNPTRIRRAIEAKSATALLLKVNQIGTLSEAADAYGLARSAGWAVTVSARSGETEDDWLADLATGWSGDQIKIGSITRSERLAKYNRLLAIEAETHFPLAPWPKV